MNNLIFILLGITIFLQKATFIFIPVLFVVVIFHLFGVLVKNCVLFVVELIVK